MRLACPECGWEPTKTSRWECDSCGYEFHLFNQVGTCPRCENRHDKAYCVEWEGGCGSYSSLEEWLMDADRGLDQLNIKKL